MKPFKIILFNLIIFAGILVVFEIGLRTFSPIDNVFSAERKSELARIVGWEPKMNTDGTYKCDTPHSLKKSENKIRVLLLGDSTLDCNDNIHRYENTVPAILSERLGEKYEVINLSAGGWGNDQEYLAYLAMGRYYSPDIVLLFFTPSNDLFNNASSKAVDDPAAKPYFTLDDKGSLMYHATHTYEESRSFYKSLMTFEIGKRIYLAIRKYQQPRFDPKSIESELYAHLSAFVNPLPEKLNKGWEVAKAIFLSLNKSVTAANGRFAIVYVPSRTLVRSDYCKSISSGGRASLINEAVTYVCVPYTHETLNVMCDGNEYEVETYQPYSLLKNFGRKYGIAVLDNMDVVEANVEYSDWYFLKGDCIHLSRYGHESLTEKIADYVLLDN